jgi:AcrR family transcriptional regulator
MILESGVENLSMRKLADRIEYSATAIYQHFADKDALLRAMCERDFDDMADDMRGRVAHLSDCVERIRANGEFYIRFATEYPDHFRVMFMTPNFHIAKLTDEDLKRRGNPSTDGYAFVRACVQGAIDAGRLRPELTDADLVTQTFWAAVHGVAAIQTTHAKDPWLNLRPLEERARLMIDTILRGMLRRP